MAIGTITPQWKNGRCVFLDDDDPRRTVSQHHIQLAAG